MLPPNMAAVNLTARVANDGLVIGRIYRVTSIDEASITFEEVVIDNPVASINGVQELGEFLVDWDRAQVKRDGMWLRLPPAAFRLLRLLASKPGRVFSYQAISSYVWGHEVPTTSITVLAKRLRYIVGDASIETIRPTGLRLVTDPHASSSAPMLSKHATSRQLPAD
jgi:DNA-binding response OmpR family regulator